VSKLQDYHTHTAASPDGHHTLLDMALAAQAAGVTELAVTEHMDYGCQAEWKSRCRCAGADEYDSVREHVYVTLVRGVELGQGHHEPEESGAFLDEYRPEFVIGSLHNLLCKIDFYYMTYTCADSAQELLRLYVEELFDMAAWGRFDVVGHLTYPLRYMPQKLGVSFKPYYHRFADLFRLLRDNGKGIEVNVSGLSHPLNAASPDLPLLKLYKECGGEIVTVGSDAHYADRVGKHIGDGYSLLKSAGFDYVSSFAGGALRFVTI
jgi:histidinol-phosphatase (PHP family)